jgi:hypothetical protein
MNYLINPYIAIIVFIALNVIGFSPIYNISIKKNKLVVGPAALMDLVLLFLFILLFNDSKMGRILSLMIPFLINTCGILLLVITLILVYSRKQ